MILSQTSPLQAPQWGSKIPSLKECLNLYSSVLKRRFWRWKTFEPSFRLQKKHFLPQLIEKNQPARKPLKPCLSCEHHLAISKLANECGAQVLKLCHHMCTYILADSVLIQSLHLIVFKRKSPDTEKPHCPQKMPLCGQPKVNLENLNLKGKARNLSNKPGSSFQAKPPNTIRPPLFQPSIQQIIHFHLVESKLCMTFQSRHRQGSFPARILPAEWVDQVTWLGHPPLHPWNKEGLCVCLILYQLNPICPHLAKPWSLNSFCLPHLNIHSCKSCIGLQFHLIWICKKVQNHIMLAVFVDLALMYNYLGNDHA